MAQRTHGSKTPPTAKRQARRAEPQAHAAPLVNTVPSQFTLDKPAAASSEAILALQRTAGNQAVQRLLTSHSVQAKLAVGPADDAAEREADRMADQVVRTPASGDTAARTQAPVVRPISPAGSAVTLRRKYDAIPTPEQWRGDSRVKRTMRSGRLESIETELKNWEAIKNGNDKHAQIAQLYALRSQITTWQTEKRNKYISPSSFHKKVAHQLSFTGHLFHPSKAHESIRTQIVADLLDAVNAKLTETQTAYRVELAPLALEVQQAAQAHDMDLTRAKGGQLAALDLEFFYSTTRDAMTAAKTTDMLEWACYYFGAPHNYFGGGSLIPYSLKAIADFGWLTQGLADKIIDDFLIPLQHIKPNDILQIFQHQPFRQKVEAVATQTKYQPLVRSMPLLRITSEVETGVRSNQVDINNIDQVAEAVFNAFLADLPISQLFYSTVTGQFKTVDYLLGQDAVKLGAPCMVLSNIFNELFKMVFPVNAPPVLQGGDNQPLLTKPLGGIGQRGILTRQNAFKGNVKRYDTVRGYDAVNRIFFGDGHIWLEINGKEYDPTLGIHGPKGTIAAAAVERHFVVSGKGKFKDGNLTATRTSEVPPNGAPLHFDRTVEIKPPFFSRHKH